MIKRPERIKIISKRFSIEYVITGTGPITGDQSGECDSLNQVITIQADLKFDTEKEVVLHEILHAISDEMALDLTEEQVAGTARGVLAVLIDNPSFARFLVKTDTKKKAVA